MVFLRIDRHPGVNRGGQESNRDEQESHHREQTGDVLVHAPNWNGPARIEEMMQERGVFVDHSTVHRWALKLLPVLEAVFRKRKRPCWQELALR